VNAGILLTSTIFNDRWEYDLFTLRYDMSGNTSWSEIPQRYLGKYSNCNFKNQEELEEKLVDYFRL